jgi:hypothetical protein
MTGSDVHLSVRRAIKKAHKEGFRQKKKVSMAAHYLRESNPAFKRMTQRALKGLVNQHKSPGRKSRSRSGGFMLNGAMNSGYNVFGKTKRATDGGYYPGPYAGRAGIPLGEPIMYNPSKLRTNAGRGTSKNFLTSFNPLPKDMGGGAVDGFLKGTRVVNGGGRRRRAHPPSKRKQRSVNYLQKLREYFLKGKGGSSAMTTRNVVVYQEDPKFAYIPRDKFDAYGVYERADE